VHIYLAGVRDPRAKRVCAQLGVRNYLLSFSLKQRAFDQNSDVLENPQCRVMVDSGAFSVWNTGRKIDVKKYADFAHKLMARARCELLLCPQINLGMFCLGIASARWPRAFRVGFFVAKSRNAPARSAIPETTSSIFFQFRWAV
jgi:hypothetical protein